MSRTYIYVVDRDFGFAPNPFHGTCTLATCKPITRRTARVGDWIVGMGGARLDAVGHCIYAMKVTSKISFDEYWNSLAYRDKIPVRNGSLRTMVGDNIYHRVNSAWAQCNSHHSNVDGTMNKFNVAADTGTDAVLISDFFYYFGRAAPEVPSEILLSMGYKNGRNHRIFSNSESASLIAWIKRQPNRNIVVADPFDFDAADSHYSVENNSVRSKK